MSRLARAQARYAATGGQDRDEIFDELAEEVCDDCGEQGVSVGHMECPFPRDRY